MPLSPMRHRGNKKSQTPPSPQGQTQFGYDNLDRLLLTTFPDGHTVGAHYDLCGNATDAIKEDGTDVVTQYDQVNRPVKVTQPLDGLPSLVTQYGYDLDGRRTSVTNPRGYVTGYGFDDRGKPSQLVSPGAGGSGNHTRTYLCDGRGNRIDYTNGNGSKVVYAYDGLGRLTGIDYPQSPDVSFQYRLDGLRSGMTDYTGTTTTTYDDAGRLLTDASTYTGKTLTTAYVPGVNRRQSLSDGTQTWTYGYDSSIRLQYVDQTVGATQPVRYDDYYPDGAVHTRTFSNGTKTVYGFDARGRALSIAHQDSSGNAQETLGYHYGADGNLDTYASSLPGNAWSTAYVHDKADRITSEIRTGGAASNFSYQYAYDPDGNRTSVVRNGTTYAYTAAWPSDAFDRGENYVYGGYDGDGNPAIGDDHNSYFNQPGSWAWNFTYDEMDRLTHVTGRDFGNYAYDGDGRRVSRDDSTGTYLFVYDGDQIVEILDANKAVREYRLPGVGFTRNGAQRFEYENALGSCVAVRDQSGALTGLTEYDAYGKEPYQNAAGGDRGDFRFAGGHGCLDDDAFGWQWMGARMYVPMIGKFLNGDPIGQQGGLNVYAYCADSPLSRVDPKGTDTRPLNAGELARMSTVADFLNLHGGGFSGAWYKAMLEIAPETFQVDTELGGAAWRQNTLYLGPRLFDQVDFGTRALSNKTMAGLQASEFEDKAWFASILYHEFDHVLHNETFRIWNPFSVGNVERRAWGEQLGFLQRLRGSYAKDLARSSRIDNLIGQAREGRSQY